MIQLLRYFTIFVFGGVFGFALREMWGSAPESSTDQALSPLIAITGNKSVSFGDTTHSQAAAYFDNRADPGERCLRLVEFTQQAVTQCLQLWVAKGGEAYATQMLRDLLLDENSNWSEQIGLRAILADRYQKAKEVAQALTWLLDYASAEASLEYSDRALQQVKFELASWYRQGVVAGDGFWSILEDYLYLHPDDTDAHLWMALRALDDQRFDQARYHALQAHIDPKLASEAKLLLARIDPPLQAFAHNLSIPLNRATNQYLLRGFIAGQEMTFLVDTGASVSAVTGVFAQKYLTNFFTGRKVLLQTAGGNYAADVVAIDNLMLGEDGDFSVEGREMVVLSAADNSNFDALLGLDVLAHFNFSIDPEDRSLILQGR